MALRLRRSRTGVVVFALLFAGLATFMLHAARPTRIQPIGHAPVELGGWSSGHIAVAVLAALVAIYAAKRFRDARHVIEIDERGILDGATGRARIAWTSVSDITCESEGERGTLVLTLRGPPAENVSVDLDGVGVPIQTVVSAAMEHWSASRERRPP